ncbi:NAD-dependent epimerase/dehydratase family protein [Vibrio coralliilyticus]|uniref:NAD-dependent epimerase/dehydratase family protein n=1 Tax=Vibrio coralliilyticus TaxID=190893 RepID=UPI0015613890|nr:NAD-dependent epimerase/dehydratase family protein [Vibrio coralliilyticus]NRF64526.1 NAD-dependent epimerase/dehydratase family protein [Vibrio coralliilyticus]
MSIFVTGASGFIGNHYIQHLRDCDIEHEVLNEKFPFSSDLQLSKGATVVHLAGMAHGKARSEEDFFLVNRDYPLLLAQLAKSQGVRRFIYLSSINVYDFEQSQPFKEETITAPSTAYEQSKLEAERGLLKLKAEDFQVVILRCPLVYGEGAPANFSRLMSLSLRSPILPFGSTVAQRSYLSVGNLCSAINTCIESTSVLHSEVYNLTDSYDLGIGQVTSMIRSAFGLKTLQLPIPETAMNFVAKIVGAERVSNSLLGSLCVSCASFINTYRWSPAETPKVGFSKLRNNND